MRKESRPNSKSMAEPGDAQVPYGSELFQQASMVTGPQAGIYDDEALPALTLGVATWVGQEYSEYYKESLFDFPPGEGVSGEAMIIIHSWWVMMDLGMLGLGPGSALWSCPLGKLVQELGG